MSEFNVIEVNFKNKNVLIDSLKQMGYKPKVFDESVNLKGYQGDTREQKAHIIIPRSQVGNASNDVGFEWIKDKYRMHASEYDRPWRTGEKIKKLKQVYAEKIIIGKISRSSKYSLKSRIEQDGKIKIRVQTLR